MVACPNCGHENADGAKFCSECGANLLAPAPRRREMRKTVTVVFCDVTGSTALGERLDPESLRGVMTRYFERMQGVLSSQVGIQIARGLLLIARGDPAGEHHVRAGIELLDDSDAMIWRVEIRLDLAHALAHNRPSEAVVLAREALALAEPKQIPVQIAAAREILAELGEDA